MQFAITNRYRLPYHGPYNDFLAVLETGSDTGKRFGEEVPFCVRVLIGRLIENACMGFGITHANAKLSIPVTALEKLEQVNLEIEFDVRLHDADAYRETADGYPIETYTDGTVTILEYEGPIKWRREYWQSAEVQLISHAPVCAPHDGRPNREPPDAKGGPS